MPRPSFNTGRGFFVVGNRLYDAHGLEFRIRGVNHLHWDDQSLGLPKSGANTERWVLDFKQRPSLNFHLMQRSKANGLIPMPGNWDGTCDRDPATLATIAQQWVATARQWQTLERHALINIANEWGPENSTVWRDAYIDAVRKVRAAGIKATLVVDTGGCGQDDQDVILHGADVLAADPEHNILFDVHVYGGWADHPTEPWVRDLATTFDALAATGLPIVIGEFGPGRNIGPSPTLLTPRQVVAAAEAHGFGWLAWAWDDPAGEYTSPPRDDWFALSATGDYVTSADLTTFGQEVIEDPTYGLKWLGRPASVLSSY